MFVQEIHVYETFHGGALIKIQARVDGSLHDIWQTNAPTDITTSRIFNPTLQVWIYLLFWTYSGHLEIPILDFLVTRIPLHFFNYESFFLCIQLRVFLF